MSKILLALLLSALPLAAQDYKIAVVGLVHSHVWGHLKTMVDGKQATLVGVAETNQDLVAEAKKAGVADNLIFADYKQMLDKVKPDIVWAFVENNRHLEIAEACAPRHINIIFEKPLAATHTQAVRIQKLAKQYNVQVMSNYQMAWWPANYIAKARADSGDLGQIYRLHGIVGHGGPGSTGARNKYFFDWLTDPVKNGAGALMDFGCYNALWSLWYLGRPETVFASANHLRPDVFPKVEDNADLVLSYPKAVGIFEASWDLPKSYQDLEVFGLKGSVYMQHSGVDEQVGKQKQSLTLNPLPVNESEPIAFMVDHMRTKKPVEGLTAIDINVQVIEIIDAAKESIRTGKAVRLAH